MANKNNTKKPAQTLPSDADSLFVQAAINATDTGYLQKLLQARQPAKIGTRFRETQSWDRLKKAKWTKANRDLPGLPGSLVAYVTSEVDGLQGLLPLTAVHEHMVLEYNAAYGVTVKGNFRKPVAETFILIEVPMAGEPAVAGILPGAPVYPNESAKMPPTGTRRTRREFEKDGFTHLTVLPR